MLFLEIDPIEPHEPAELYLTILVEGLQLIGRIVPLDLAPIRTEEILQPELDLLPITHRIEQAFQEHLLTEDLLPRILVLPEVIAALAILLDPQGITEALEALLDPDLPEVFEALEDPPDLQVACVVLEVPPDPQEVYGAQVVPPGPQAAAGLVEDLAEEDNSSN